jgi:penicillin-binding protein 1A
MSDFDNNNNNNKDYDLDYFAEKKDQPSDDFDSVPITQSEDFDLNTFSSDAMKSGEIEFSDIEPLADDEEIDFNSFGKKRKEVKKENFKFKKQNIKKILKTTGKVAVSVMLIGIITGCLMVGAFAVYVFNFVDDRVYEDLDELTLDFTTTIYTRDSQTGEYVEYQRLHAEENRIWVGFDEMPYHLQKAFVAIEDDQFYDHKGVDWKRTVAAFGNMFLHYYSSNQGGSTITQQLVKNLTGDDEQSPMRKIREIMRARYLESEYEKDTILECYLNTLCLANGIYGVEVASNYYFGKTTSELTIAECASIASLAKNPERYRPDKFPERNRDRRNLVLKYMYDQGYLSEEEYLTAKNSEVTVVADESALSKKTVNNYFVDAVVEEVIDRLVEEHHYDRAYASKNFYNGGYKIYCTVNPEVQETLEKEYLKTKEYFTLKSKKDPSKTVQSAFTIMDYEGHIVGIVGGAGEKTENRGFNRATMSYRQPGSTMKPLASYSQAIQKNLINFSSILEDSPLPKYYQSGEAGPKNSYSYYRGNITVAKALEVSTNTIPCKLVKKMGVENTYYHLETTMGIETLDATNDMNLSALGLGGTTTGITTTQSAASFAIFGNLGNYYEPTTFTLMTDQHDNVILKQKSGKQAIDENTATVMNYLLRRVVYGDNGTGEIAAGFSETMKCYAKTGTTSDVYDCWFVGGTPYYVGSCWFGFDANEKINNSKLAKNMWTNVMKELHADLEPKEFVDSEFVTHRYFCASTGKLATDTCPAVEAGCYKTNYSLPGVCTAHEGNVLPDVGAEIPKEEEKTEDGEQTPETPDNGGNNGQTPAPNPDNGEGTTPNPEDGNGDDETDGGTDTPAEQGDGSGGNNE